MVDESFAGDAEDLDAARLRARNWVVIPPSEVPVSSESLRDEENSAAPWRLPEGPALVYVRQNGSVVQLDTLPREVVSTALPEEGDALLSGRDRWVISALWSTFTDGHGGPWRSFR